MRYIIVGVFIVMVIAQWAVPVSMIMGEEDNLKNGTEYRFKTRPVDPSDPFRGKYVTLSFEAEQYSPADTNETHFERDDEVYATIAPDEDGFAKVIHISAEPPGDVDAYLQTKVMYANVYDGEGHVTLDFPFNRFYLEESKASDAERLAWSSRDDSTRVTYAKVMVGKGQASLVDVIVNDTSIVDVVRRINQKH